MLKFRFLAIVAVFALVAAACGDSGTTELADDTSPPDTSSSGDPTAATSGDTAPPATAAPSTAIGTIPVTIGNIPGLSDDCQALANVFLSFSGVFLGGDVPDVNIDAISDLPGDLQADVALVIAGLEEYADGLAELGVDLTDPASFAALTEEQQQAFGDLADSIDTDEFNDAADRFSAYAEVECAEFVGG